MSGISDSLAQPNGCNNQTMNEPRLPIFEALADATRRRVLVALVSKGPATATGLADAFPVTRQAITKHLQVLLDAGVVRLERIGRETQWTFVPGSLGPAARWLDEMDDSAVETLGTDTVRELQQHLEAQRQRRGLTGVRAAASARRPRPT
jgi:DNA-binding transcriptional ArsR family regulator